MEFGLLYLDELARRECSGPPHSHGNLIGAPLQGRRRNGEFQPQQALVVGVRVDRAECDRLGLRLWRIEPRVLPGRTTCVQGGRTTSGESAFFTLSATTAVNLPEIVIGSASHIPVSLAITPATPNLTSAGQIVQLTVTARYPDNSTRNVTAGSTGTNYTSHLFEWIHHGSEQRDRDHPGEQRRSHGDDYGAQAVLMTGAQSVVASVWPAEDAFTANLMQAFYENLRAGHDKAEALTFAKRQMISTYGQNASPLLWGGFRLMGDARGKVWRGDSDE